MNTLGEKISLRIGVIFAKTKIPPNYWTGLSLILGVLGFLALAYYKSLGAGLVFFFLAGSIDMIDGAVARVMGRVTNFGAYFDGISDRYVEGFLLLGLILYGLPAVFLPASFWIAVLMIGSFIGSYARAYADHRNAIKDVSILGKKWRTTRAIRFILLWGSFLAGITAGELYFTYGIILTAAVSHVAALQRILFVYKNRAD